MNAVVLATHAFGLLGRSECPPKTNRRSGAIIARMMGRVASYKQTAIVRALADGNGLTSGDLARELRVAVPDVRQWLTRTTNLSRPLMRYGSVRIGVGARLTELSAAQYIDLHRGNEPIVVFA